MERKEQKILRPIRKFRVIFNDDSDTLCQMPKPHTKEKISLAIDYLKDTQVDCLCWCVAEQMAHSYPSKVVGSFFERKAEEDKSRYRLASTSQGSRRRDSLTFTSTNWK